LPTAAGKTIIFAEATRLAQLKGTTALVAVHRRELVAQAVAKLRDVGIEPGIIAAGEKPTRGAPVQVCSIQTAIRRDLDPATGLLIIDEAHHSTAESYRRLAAMLPQARLLGVTATPARLDGKGLGIHAHGLFDDLIIGATVRELTEAGYLCPARTFTMDRRAMLRGVKVTAGDYNQGQLAQVVAEADLAGDAVVEYAKRAAHQPAIAFCVTVEHAEATASQFALHGYRAACIHGGLATVVRDRLLDGLRTGAIEVLTSCEILGEGVDIPSIGCAILLRPTRSLTVYLQQVGRGLRPAPGKACLVVLDCAGNACTHGLPDEEHDWSLDAAPKRAAPDIMVDADGEAHRKPLVVDRTAQLVELHRSQLERICRLPYRAFVSRQRSDAEIAAYRRHHGYKPGWEFYTKRLMAELEAVA
jgi:superfamily II DNA or RNA helicase